MAVPNDTGKGVVWILGLGNLGCGYRAQAVRTYRKLIEIGFGKGHKSVTAVQTGWTHRGNGDPKPPV